MLTDIGVVILSVITAFILGMFTGGALESVKNGKEQL